MDLINLFIPSNYKIIILKNNFNKNIQIFIYNNNWFIKLIFLNLELIQFNKNTNTFKIKTNYNCINFQNKFYNFLKNINFLKFLKIKFKGKGYKLEFFKKKTFNGILFHFGSSNIKIIKFNNIIVNKINKYKYILLYNNLKKLKNIGIVNTNIKKINPYTLRGLRLSKSIIFKKKGKKGSWI